MHRGGGSFSSSQELVGLQKGLETRVLKMASKLPTLIIIKKKKHFYSAFLPEDTKRSCLLLRYHFGSPKGATGQVHTLSALSF